MAFCKNCGTQIADDAKFCGTCGVSQKEEKVEKRAGLEIFLAVLSYFGILAVIPIIARRNDRFIRFHINQGLFNFVFFFLAELAVALISAIINALGADLLAVGGILGAFSGVLGIVSLILVIVGIVNAVNEREEELFLYKMQVFDKIKEKASEFIKKAKSEATPKSENTTEKVVCLLAYLPPLFFLPLVICDKGSLFARHHATHALVSNAAALVLSVFSAFFGIVNLIPVFGPIAFATVTAATSLVTFTLTVWGMVSASFGKTVTLPFMKKLKIF